MNPNRYPLNPPSAFRISKRPGIDISLAEYLRTGELGSIGIGVRKEVVISVFDVPTGFYRGNTDDISPDLEGGSPSDGTWMNADVWCYGDLNLAFDSDCVYTTAVHFSGQGFPTPLNFFDLQPGYEVTLDQMQNFLQKHNLSAVLKQNDESIEFQVYHVNGQSELLVMGGYVASIILPIFMDQQNLSNRMSDGN